MAVGYDVEAAVASSLKKVEAEAEGEVMTIEMSAAAASLLEQLTVKMDRPLKEVFAQAFSLLYAGVTAQRDGFQLAVVDKDGEIQTTFDLLTKD